MRLLVVVFLTLSACSGCRTGWHKKDDVVESATTAISNADNAPKTFDEPISYLEVSDPTNKNVYGFTVKTEVEVMCERTCSHFEMVEEASDGVIGYKSIRKPELGNTTPSRLDETRMLAPLTDKYKQVVVKNVGKVGNNIVITDVMKSGRVAFYATMADIKPSVALDGAGSKLQIVFNGKTLDAVLDDQKLSAKVAPTKDKPATGFVTGYVTKETKPDHSEISVFHVVDVDTEISF